MATVSSMASPQWVIVPSARGDAPPPKMTALRTSVRISRAAMTMTLMRPRFFQSQHDPQRDESCYDDAPEGRTDSRNRIGRYGRTGNHDGSPADKLDDIQSGK